MKENLVRKFIEKLDYSYSYKTKNERQNIINELCEIAGIKQLTIPVVNCQREQLPEQEYCECLTNYRFDKNGLCEGCGAKKG